MVLLIYDNVFNNNPICSILLFTITTFYGFGIERTATNGESFE